MNNSQITEEKAQIPNALEIAMSIRRECRKPTNEDYELINQAAQDLLYIGNEHQRTLELTTPKNRNPYKWSEFEC